jgi:integrase
MSGQTLAQISRAAFLVAPPSPAVLQQAEAFAQSVRAASTRAAYAADWQHFERWCACRGFASLPADPGAVALYLTEAASSQQCSVATLSRRLVAVAQRHVEEGLEPPTRAVRVRSVFRGIRRQIGTAQRRKAPMLPEDLEKVLPTFGDGIKGVRNKALLLLGFAGAFRRAELVSLDWKDIAEERQGLTITIRRSKTDPFGAGRQVAIPYAKNKAL